MKTSVALCTYNGEQFLAEQLDSILNQTQKVDEIVICDDGSTDRTLDILRQYQKAYPEIIHIHQNKETLRSVKNFEKAIGLCQNEIIFLSDQDDIWLPNKVEYIVNFLQSNPHISVVATHGFGIDQHGNPIEDVYSLWDLPNFFKELNNNKVDYFKIFSLCGNIATGASMAFRKSFIGKTFPFPIINNIHHDEWIALNAVYKNTFDFIPTKLFKYRIHPGQQVGGVFFPKRKKRNFVEIFDGRNKSFSNYKKVLKKLSNLYNTNKRLNNPQNSEFMEKANRLVKLIFLKEKQEMLKKYPIKARFLMISDFILNKRQLL